MQGEVPWPNVNIPGDLGVGASPKQLASWIYALITQQSQQAGLP